MGWPSHACAPGIQGMSLQLSSHLQGNRKRKGGRSLSLNNVRTRIKDRRHRVAHSPYPQLFSPLPTFPHYIPRAHIYFFHPPHRAGGIFSIQLWRGQDRTTSVGTPRSWLPSVSDQTLAVKSTRKTQPSLPFSSFSRRKLPTLTLTPLPRLNIKCFQSPQIAVCMSKGFVGGVSEKSSLQHACFPSTL